MRVLIQLLVPALIVVGVVLIMEARRRTDRRSERARNAGSSDTGAFLVILGLGAAVAVATAVALQSLWY
jgi:hypothetical protein